MADLTDASDFLTTVYSDADRGPADTFYNAWASTYDADLEAGGYRAPKRCAETLARLDPARSGPVADLGCGTGLSGLALRAQGFEPVDGFDVSEEMVAQARAKGCYRALSVTDLSDPANTPKGPYAHALLVGVIGIDHAPVGAAEQALGMIEPGGFVVLTINDKALAVPEFPARIEALGEQPGISLVVQEYGEHFPAHDIGAMVYALRRDRN